jgi:4-hydroxy-tetrahydrodipicolinate synthase
MKSGGDIDWAALERLVEYHISNQTDGIVAVGTTGESATLDFDEHNEVIRKVIDLAGGRLPVIAGTGANSTREAIELTEKAAALGADACLLVTPYYNKPTQEGLYLHYRAIAEAVDIPQILYNVPGRTACDLADETTLRLAEIDNIVGLKDATGDMQRAAQLVAQRPGGFALYSGDDATALEFLLHGGDGVISVTANVAPLAMHDMVSAALGSDEVQAREIDQRLQALHHELFVESNPIPVKWAVQEMGLIDSGIRLPLTPLASTYQAGLREVLRQAGLV